MLFRWGGGWKKVKAKVKSRNNKAIYFPNKNAYTVFTAHDSGNTSSRTRWTLRLQNQGTIITDRRRDSRPLLNIPVATPLENALYTAGCKTRLHNPTSPTTSRRSGCLVQKRTQLKVGVAAPPMPGCSARPAEEDGFSSAVFRSFFFFFFGLPLFDRWTHTC